MMAKKGFALIAVLAIAVLLGIATIAVLQAALNVSQIKGEYHPTGTNFRPGLNTQYVVEAAVQEMLWKCRQDGTCDNLPSQVTIDGCVVNITKTVVSEEGPFKGLTQIDAETTC